jgi:predicted nucleic acid-binding Zn ribbon protein
MVLKFVFETEAENGIIEKILIRVAKRLNIKLGLSRDIKSLNAYIDGNEEDIDNFSRELSGELPLSIFLKSLNADVVEEFKDDLKREFPELNVPPCPKCLREVKDPENENYYNPFHHCEVCGYRVNEKLKVKSEKWKEKFENLAYKLKNEGRIYIQTMNGKYEVSANLEDAEQIVAVDLAAVATYFMSFEGDAKALGSIEKPLVNLKTNLNFKKEFGLSNPAYYVKLPDCMVIELLCEEIKSDIKLLGLKRSGLSTDFEFEIDNKDEIITAVVTDTRNHNILVQKGERCLLPKFEKYLGTDSYAVNGKYAALSGEGKTVIDFKDRLPGGAETKEVSKPFAGYFGVMNQYALEEKVTMGFAFYKEDESKIMMNSPKFGLVEYIEFDFKYNSIKDVFAEISAMDETGPKLIENYSKKNPELFNKIINLDLTTQKKGIAYLWGLIAVILGFSDNIDNGYKSLLEYSNSAMAKKGPRIDYKMKDKNLNPLWAVRTAMSFKLAGVDSFLLSYGVVESFAEFLTNTYEQVTKESPLDGAVIVGDLFEGEFLNKIYTNISKNYPVFVPKALSVSGAVEAYGEAVIISKS